MLCFPWCSALMQASRHIFCIAFYIFLMYNGCKK
nr:MAG TPA: hypothetical protein [Caudoviricetes sp.]